MVSAPGLGHWTAVHHLALFGAFMKIWKRQPEAAVEVREAVLLRPGGFPGVLQVNFLIPKGGVLCLSLPVPKNKRDKEGGLGTRARTQSDSNFTLETLNPLILISGALSWTGFPCLTPFLWLCSLEAVPFRVARMMWKVGWPHGKKTRQPIYFFSFIHMCSEHLPCAGLCA